MKISVRILKTLNIEEIHISKFLEEAAFLLGWSGEKMSLTSFVGCTLVTSPWASFAWLLTAEAPSVWWKRNHLLILFISFSPLQKNWFAVLFKVLPSSSYLLPSRSGKMWLIPWTNCTCSTSSHYISALIRIRYVKSGHAWSNRGIFQFWSPFSDGSHRTGGLVSATEL